MAVVVAEAVLVSSQQALAALQEQLDAAEKALEAAGAVRSGLPVGAGSMEDAIRAVEVASELAKAASEGFKRAHDGLMDVHYAARRGDAVATLAKICSSARDERTAQDGETDNAVKTAIARRQAEAYARHWAVPEDASSRAAGASSDGGPTAAAAAFAAAEDIARRRSTERPEDPRPGGGFGGCAEDSKKPIALVKVAGGKKDFDFSMFHKEAWERAQQQADAMLAEQEAGVFCWRESMPHPQQKIQGCLQVKVRHVQTNTEEKIRRAYMAMAAGGGSDRNGFLLGANLGRFITLAKEKSDSPEAKNGGDLGWVTRGKLEAKLEEVAFCCPRGACSPPFRVKLAGFHILFCEDRR